ncbi:MAG: nucleoside triphosphate pyrophosphohydrolase [Deferrisomatales bacterium]|nr:nucleoside triphosphate pyrophosphohydrolase [Deferrisomatales bacterium]
MRPLDPETPALFLRLLEIVETLRSPEGCPWDREQTPRTIAPYLVEEAHEVQEAVERGDPQEVCEELGDVLLEVALLSQMGREEGSFTAADCLRAICAKLVRRHPHVFGGASARDAAAVRESWARIKAAEGGKRGALEGVPRRLPALHRARRVSEKAAGVGFDWADPAGVLKKVEEELAELRAAVAAGSRSDAEEELGDLLFALVNLGRHLGLDPEGALHGTTEKFLSRFARVEEGLAARGLRPAEASTEEIARLWNQAKASLRASSAPETAAQDPHDPGSVAQTE